MARVRPPLVLTVGGCWSLREQCTCVFMYVCYVCVLEVGGCGVEVGREGGGTHPFRSRSRKTLQQIGGRKAARLWIFSTWSDGPTVTADR